MEWVPCVTVSYLSYGGVDYGGIDNHQVTAPRLWSGFLVWLSPIHLMVKLTMVGLTITKSYHGGNDNTAVCHQPESRAVGQPCNP